MPSDDQTGISPSERFRRLFREPRRLVGVLALVIMAAVVVVRVTHPHSASHFPPIVGTIAWTVLGSAGAVGLFLRLSMPTPPAYFSDPADPIFLLGAPVKPWELMLRRYWTQLVAFWRAAISLVYVFIIVPGSFDRVFRAMLLGLFYVLILDVVGIFGERLKRAHMPIVAIGRVLALLMLGIALIPVLRTHPGSSNVFGRALWYLTGSWARLLAEALIAFAVMALHVRFSPPLASLNWDRLKLSALRRQAVRGERSMADVARARSALRASHRTVHLKPRQGFHSEGAWVLFEAKLRMWGRGTAGRTWAVVLALAAVGAGYLLGRDWSAHGIPVLAFLSYIMIFAMGSPPAMITSPLVVGSPRTVPLLMAEQGPSFIGWLAAYGFFWTMAALFGLSPHIVILGYAWILALTLVMTAWKLYIWSWFPDTGSRNLAGRLVLMVGGFIIGGMALVWLWLPGGPLITVPWAVAEMWVLYRLTLRRLTWAIGLSRVNRGE